MFDFNTLIVLAAAAMTLGLYSYLYRENIFFRIAEHAFVGAAAGYSALISMESAWRLLHPHLDKGEYYWLITIPIGLMYVFFFSRKYFWIYRYPTAIVIGSGIGVFIARGIKTQLIARVTDTISNVSLSILTPFDGVIRAIGVVSALLYFYATMEHKGPMQPISKLGRYFLMAAFGSSFGVTIMTRISLFIGRLRFLYFTYPAQYVVVLAAVMLIAAIIYDHMRKVKV